MKTGGVSSVSITMIRYAKLNDVTSLPVLRRKKSLTWLDSVCALQGELSSSSERPVLRGDLAQRGRIFSSGIG